MTRPFRFGVVAPLATDLPTWRARVRRIADVGYSTLLMPDVPQWQPAPGPTLAFAAALANLRVGTWVYASPLRPPWITAWEAHSLSVLNDGRFEMGVGVDVALVDRTADFNSLGIVDLRRVQLAEFHCGRAETGESVRLAHVVAEQPGQIKRL